MKVLAIDPSINNLGWAIMDSSCTSIITSGTLNVTGMKSEDIVKRIDAMIYKLNRLFIGCLRAPTMPQKFDIVIIERPEPWGAYKSMASSRSGSMQILTLIVGALVQWAIQAIDVENTFLIKVSTWKGQLPKGITQERMEKKYQCKFRTDHEADAVGLGDYFIEKEKQDANTEG